MPGIAPCLLGARRIPSSRTMLPRPAPAWMAPRLALGLLLWIGSLPSPAATPPPPQGAALLKTDILGVFAHPDDETGMAATLARYGRGLGKSIAHALPNRGFRCHD